MWSDKETEHDCLGYTTYVQVLLDVCTMKDLAPLTLGVFGSWGSGKTSLMRMLKKEIDASGAGTTMTLWFNAWSYEGREEAQSALVHAILSGLEKGKTLGDEAKDLVKKLVSGASVLKLAKFITKTAITMTPNISEFIGCFADESKQVADTMESFEANFGKLLSEVGVDRIVVFIDDLDRCSSAKVIETFETIKLFLNTPACTFVIGADPTKIERAVGEVYSVADVRHQKDYLEKIVQIPFMIPEQAIEDVTCYVGMLVIGQYLDECKWERFSSDRPSLYQHDDGVAKACAIWSREHRELLGTHVDQVSDDLNAVLPYTSIVGRGLRGNPRQIKRFLNILGLRRRLAEANKLVIEPGLLVKFTVLEYVWSDFFNILVDTPSDAILPVGSAC